MYARDAAACADRFDQWQVPGAGDPRCWRGQVADLGALEADLSDQAGAILAALDMLISGT
jgi:hypothetical protein